VNRYELVFCLVQRCIRQDGCPISTGPGGLLLVSKLLICSGSVLLFSSIFHLSILRYAGGLGRFYPGLSAELYDGEDGRQGRCANRDIACFFWESLVAHLCAINSDFTF
jgi:hypothetical protein